MAQFATSILSDSVFKASIFYDEAAGGAPPPASLYWLGADFTGTGSYSKGEVASDFDTIFTHTRTSQGTFRDSNGRWRMPGGNYILDSTQIATTFDNSASMTITPDATTDPDATTLADELVPTAGLANHQIYSNTVDKSMQMLPGAVPRFSIYLKGNGAPGFYLSIGGGYYTAGGSHRAYFDIDGSGVVTYRSKTGNVTGNLVESVGSGWYRITAIFSPTEELPTSGRALEMGTAELGTSFYTAVAGENVYVYGAQLSTTGADLHDSSAFDYVGTSATAPAATACRTGHYNGSASTWTDAGVLLSGARSERIYNTANPADWDAVSGQTSTYDLESTTLLPPVEGCKVARSLEQAGFARSHRVYATLNSSSAVDQVASMFVKPIAGTGGTRYYQLRLIAGSSTTAANAWASFDLSGSGSVASTGGTYYGGAYVEQYPDGWFRISVYTLNNVGSLQTLSLNMVQTSTTENESYLGTTDTGFYYSQIQQTEGYTPHPPILAFGSQVTTGQDTLTASIAGNSELTSAGYTSYTRGTYSHIGGKAHTFYSGRLNDIGVSGKSLGVSITSATTPTTGVVSAIVFDGTTSDTIASGNAVSAGVETAFAVAARLDNSGAETILDGSVLVADTGTATVPTVVSTGKPLNFYSENSMATISEFRAVDEDIGQANCITLTS